MALPTPTNLEPDDPCTCGSGKPHHACCMRAEEKARQELDGHVLAARPGMGMRMRLTGEERFVFETVGSRGLRVGSSVLGRVASFSRKACFCGVHPRPMSRSAAPLVAHKARELVARGRPLPEGAPIPMAWMQQEGTPGLLVDLWDDVSNASLAGPPPGKSMN